MNPIEVLEKELVELAGPLAVFVVKKQIKDMGFSRETFPEERIGELIERSVKNAIFDPAKQRDVIRKLKKNLVYNRDYA